MPVAARDRALGLRHRWRGRTGLLLALAAIVLLPAGVGWAGDGGHHPVETARLTAVVTEPEPVPDVSTEPTPSKPPTSESPTLPAEPPVTEPPASPTPTEPPATEPPTPTEPPAPTGPPVTGPSTAPEQTLPPPPGRPKPGTPRLGVYVTSEDLRLTPAYWNAERTILDLRVTVANTGDTQASIRLDYQLPAGLADAGTKGCVRSGSTQRCAPWAVPAGARFSTRLRIEVGRDAWRLMPLSGLIRATAIAPGHPALAPITDEQGFAVLFPPGPPDARVSLSAGEVSFDISGRPATLDVKLGNTGPVDATGVIEVILPGGVTVPEPPARCASAAAGRTRCELGVVAAGAISELRLTVAASAEAQRQAPMSGAIVGTLQPSSGAARQVQMSFRIMAAAAGVPAESRPGIAPTASQGVLAGSTADGSGTGTGSVRLTAITLIVVSVLLVVLAFGLAMASARRRTGVRAGALEQAPVTTE